MKQSLPNFFIVGAPKAGTTSLYHYLMKHPDIYMSPVKEPNYFSYDETIKQNLYHKEKGVGKWDEYVHLFAHANGHKAIGEASVSYLFYPSVPEKIHAAFPNAKIIIVLRNPVERAYSHYHMEYKLGYVDESIDCIVSKTSKDRNAHLHYQQYVELGLYYEQVKRYLDTFSKERVIIFFFDELAERVEEIVTELFAFLNVDMSKNPPVERKYNSYSTPRNKFFRKLYGRKGLRTLAKKVVPNSGIDAVKTLFLSKSKIAERNPETVAALNTIYKPDVIKLEKLLGKNLSAWYE